MSHPPDPPPKNYTSVIVAMVVCLILLLVAATIYAEVTSDSATAPVPITASPVSTYTAPNPEDQFVVAYRDRTEDYRAEVADIIGLGYGICAEIDKSRNPMTAVGRLFTLYTPEDSGFIVANAVGYLCPRHLDKLPHS